jgi:hypothetical protein
MKAVKYFQRMRGNQGMTPAGAINCAYNDVVKLVVKIKFNG